MYSIIGYCLLAIQIIILIIFILHKVIGKNIESKLWIYFIILFILNFVIYLIPIIYVVEELNNKINHLYNVLKSLIYGVQLFLFNVNNTDSFTRLATTYDIYSIVLTIEALLSLSFTIICIISLFKKVTKHEDI